MRCSGKGHIVFAARRACHSVLVLVLLTGFYGCSTEEQRILTYRSDHTYTPVVKTLREVPAGRSPKNIILMIGDGMGLTQVSAAWVVNHGQLNMDAFPYTGLSRTYCTDTLITDSGAGGTALATGYKTRKAHIGTDADGRDLTSLLGYAHSVGKRTGVSVVCRLCDATPADFCCHTDNRDLYDDIIADYLEGTADYVAGGGMYFFTHRQDGRNIFRELGEKGYHLYCCSDSLFQAAELPVFAVLADSEYVASPARGDLFLRQSMHAIRLLQSDEGFVMMVEGSCIDDYCHANQLGTALEEVLDFDRTVGAVLQWAEEDGETLVVVTADHETGAMTLHGGSIARGEAECVFGNQSHSGVVVPVYAYGPGAERFTGIMENAEIGRRLIEITAKNACTFETFRNED